MGFFHLVHCDFGNVVAAIVVVVVVVPGADFVHLFLLVRRTRRSFLPPGDMAEKIGDKKIQ